MLKCLETTAYRATKRGADRHITSPTKPVGVLEIETAVSNVPWLQESTMFIRSKTGLLVWLELNRGKCIYGISPRSFGPQSNTSLIYSICKFLHQPLWHWSLYQLSRLYFLPVSVEIFLEKHQQFLPSFQFVSCNTKIIVTASWYKLTMPLSYNKLWYALNEYCFLIKSIPFIL